MFTHLSSGGQCLTPDLSCINPSKRKVWIIDFTNRINSHRILLNAFTALPVSSSSVYNVLAKEQRSLLQLNERDIEMHHSPYHHSGVFNHVFED